jgi:hypothetical protein
MSDTQKDTIILHLREIIRELEKENKDLCKKLGLLYRPKNQPERDEPNGGTGETKGGAGDV